MGTTEPDKTPDDSPARTAFRRLLGATLIFTGTSHLTFARKPFRAQVPRSIPLPDDLVVVLSGFVEIGMGASLIFLTRFRKMLGWIAAIFFVAIFPGNISQYINRRNAFGLDTDGKRFARLWAQPLLVAWAVWATGAMKGDRRSGNFDK